MTDSTVGAPSGELIAWLCGDGPCPDAEYAKVIRAREESALLPAREESATSDHPHYCVECDALLPAGPCPPELRQPKRIKGKRLTTILFTACAVMRCAEHAR